MDNIDNIKVYKMNDYDWVASKWDIEKTNEYYSEEFDDNHIECVAECDIDKDGMWYETTNKADIEMIGDSDGIMSKAIGCTIGDLMRRDSEVYKFTSFRQVLEESDDFTEPYVIATTEW